MSAPPIELPWLSASTSGVHLEVQVQPRASRSRVVGLHDGRLKIALAAPPVDGAANDALVLFLSDLLDIPRRSVELVAGHTGRRKRVHLAGARLDDVRARLTAALG